MNFCCNSLWILMGIWLENIYLFGATHNFDKLTWVLGHSSMLRQLKLGFLTSSPLSGTHHLLPTRPTTGPGHVLHVTPPCLYPCQVHPHRIAMISAFAKPLPRVNNPPCPPPLPPPPNQVPFILLSPTFLLELPRYRPQVIQCHLRFDSPSNLHPIAW